MRGKPFFCQFSDFPIMKIEKRIKHIPMMENRSNFSPKIITLNSVAAIGSTMPRADAVPTGKLFIESVYKK